MFYITHVHVQPDSLAAELFVCHKLTSLLWITAFVPQGLKAAFTNENIEVLNQYACKNYEKNNILRALMLRVDGQVLFTARLL